MYRFIPGICNADIKFDSFSLFIASPDLLLCFLSASTCFSTLHFTWPDNNAEIQEL